MHASLYISAENISYEIFCDDPFTVRTVCISITSCYKSHANIAFDYMPLSCLSQARENRP